MEAMDDRDRRPRSPPCRRGEVVDIYDWMRNLAMRIAMRALLGLDPDEAGKGAAAAEHFERALGYYGIDFALRLLRGPGSPWRKLIASREVLDEIVFGEIARRRAEPDPERRDILSLLVGARGEAGEAFTDREVRDQVMTLMFAGHDTSTSTLTFLSTSWPATPRSPPGCARSRTGCSAAPRPTPEQLEREMPYLDMVLDEVLRLYPPAWIGPRRAVREFDFGGYTVPRGAYVNYCSWASHRIPEVFPDPEAFIPERFTRERKAALPRGAYVPFGGGQRICIGKRFGQTEVKLVATMLLQQLDLGALPGPHDDGPPDADALAQGRAADAGRRARRVEAPARIHDDGRRCARWSSPTPTSGPGRGGTCCGRSSSSSAWRRSWRGSTS